MRTSDNVSSSIWAPGASGGSVKPSNARAILALPEVGGALVGGASLKSEDFAAIVASAPAVAAPEAAE